MKRASDLGRRTADFTSCASDGYSVFETRRSEVQRLTSVYVMTIVTMLAQLCPGVKLARMLSCTGNRLRSSPQKPMVDEVPSCRKVTKVTCTVLPPSPMTALSCTTLTVPLTLAVLGLMTPRMKMFPQPVRVTTRQVASKKEKRRFTALLPVEL